MANRNSYRFQIHKDRKERDFWTRHFKVPENLDEIPKNIERVSLRKTDGPIYDNALDYITYRIRRILQLDLDDTEITNEGIEYLTRLDCLKELRLKGCSNLDNGCVASLIRIKELELLHLEGTNVTVSGLENIYMIATLRTLLISADRGEPETEEKLRNIAIQLPPGCEFIVNHKDYELK